MTRNVMKFDHSFENKEPDVCRASTSAKGGWSFRAAMTALPPARQPAAPGNRVRRPHFGIAFNDTHLISPHTTVDVRLGYARGVEDNKPGPTASIR